MKNASEILLALGLSKSKETMQHAGKFADIFRLFEQVKKTIVSIERKPEKLFFGKTSKEVVRRGVLEKDEITTGTEQDGERFTAITDRGKYSVVIPTGNGFHAAFCTLLGVQSNEIVVQKKVLNTFILPASVLNNIKQAKAFASTDDLRPVTMCVNFEIINNKGKIVCTDCHKIYISETFDVIGKSGNHEFLLPVSALKKIPTTSEDTFEFDVLEDFKVSFLGLEIELCTEGKYMDWRCVVPEYKKSMVIDRYDMIQKVKEVIPYTNKATTQVNFYMNGNIEMTGQDVDFSFETNVRMAYIKKNIPDFKIAFNGKFLVTTLKAFNTDEIQMFTDGHPSKGAIFTDGRDTVLMMSLMLNDSYSHYAPEPEPVKEQIDEATLKAFKVFSNYVNWLFCRGAAVSIIQYNDRLVIRSVLLADKKVVRMEKTISLTEAREKYLVPQLEGIMHANDKKIINKAA